MVSPTLVETGPGPLPRLEDAGTVEASLTEDGVRVVGPVDASRIHSREEMVVVSLKLSPRSN